VGSETDVKLTSSDLRLAEAKWSHLADYRRLEAVVAQHRDAGHKGLIASWSPDYEDASVDVVVAVDDVYRCIREKINELEAWLTERGMALQP
jgi:hypothetical protein